MNAHENGIQAGAISALDHVRLFLEGYITSYDYATKIISAYLEASGMVLVPREPTEEMLVSGLKDCDPLGGLVDWQEMECTKRKDVESVYCAMLAAAPSPFSQANTEGEKA